MFKRKYLTTNQEVIVDHAAGNVTVIIVDAVAVVVDVVDAVELESIFENLFYHHFK